VKNSHEELEPHFVFANLFIKKQLPAWKAFFHQFITGYAMAGAQTSVKIDITPGDLISISNQDIYRTLVCPITKSKQKDMFAKIFNLEKQTNDWPSEKIEDVTVSFKRFPGSTVVVMRMEQEINATVDQVMSFTKKICLSEDPTEMVGGNMKKELLTTYNDNLRLFHCTVKAHPLLKPRDFITLNYSEYLPEEKFGISAVASIDKPEYPPTKDLVRGDILVGILYRGTSNNKTSVTKLLHMDTKGSTITPNWMLKKALSRPQVEMSRVYAKQFPADPHRATM